MALALALSLASHGANTDTTWSIVGAYIYWLARIGMAFLVIIGAHAALAQAMSNRSSPFAHAGLAAALSFPIFVFFITTMDLVIGDLDLLRSGSGVLLQRIGIEAASLIDNHLITCAILLSPYLWVGFTPVELAQPAMQPAYAAATEQTAAETSTPAEPELPGLLLACQPPLRGDLLAAEAQEHYVKLKGTIQSGMALYRFGDAVRDLSRYQGMQIHRSHWVSDEAVTAVIGKRGSLKIELVDGEVVPVSRRYELEVEARYGGRGRRDE
ncbi:MAG: LytTR family DNA-binding domain-containing protein [Pseudomonadota bacterium]